MTFTIQYSNSKTGRLGHMTVPVLCHISNIRGSKICFSNLNILIEDIESVLLSPFLVEKDCLGFFHPKTFLSLNQMLTLRDTENYFHFSEINEFDFQINNRYISQKDEFRYFPSYSMLRSKQQKQRSDNFRSLEEAMDQWFEGGFTETDPGWNVLEEVKIWMLKTPEDY